MKKKIFFITLIELIVGFIYYYIALPPINISSNDFWSFVIFLLAILLILVTLSNFTGDFKTIFTKKRLKDYSKGMIAIIGLILLIVIGMSVVNFFCSPIFNAKSYSNRIKIDESVEFTRDI